MASTRTATTRTRVSGAIPAPRRRRHRRPARRPAVGSTPPAWSTSGGTPRSAASRCCRTPNGAQADAPKPLPSDAEVERFRGILDKPAESMTDGDMAFVNAQRERFKNNLTTTDRRQLKEIDAKHRDRHHAAARQHIEGNAAFMQGRRDAMVPGSRMSPDGLAAYQKFMQIGPYSPPSVSRDPAPAGAPAAMYGWGTAGLHGTPPRQEPTISRDPAPAGAAGSADLKDAARDLRAAARPPVPAAMPGAPRVIQN